MGNPTFADADAFTVTKRPVPRTGELLPVAGVRQHRVRCHQRQIAWKHHLMAFV